MRVNVIIPCHNYGRFLREAIDSVRVQTMDDLEIIVVDDGSTDETQGVLARIADTEPRLRVVTLPKVGYSTTLNTALGMVRGEFITFLDADDRWHPKKLELQLGMMNAEPQMGVVFTDFSRFNEKGSFPKTQFSFFPEISTIATRPAGGLNEVGRVIEGDAFTTLLSFGQFPAWLQTTMIRTELVKDLRFPLLEQMHGIDLYYMLQVYRRTQAGFITQPLVEVRRHGNNSYTGVENKLKGDLAVLLEIEKDNLSAEHRSHLKQRIGKLMDAIGYYYFWNGSGRLAARNYLQSLQYPGARWQSLKHLAAIPALPVLPRKEVAEWID